MKKFLKGVMEVPITAIASMVITMFLLGLIVGNQALTNQFVKQETLDIKTNRVVNSVISMESISKGSMQIDIQDYGIKVDGRNISMNYSGSNVTKKINDSMTSSSIDGPSTYEDIEKNMCIKKKPGLITVEAEGC